MKLNREQKKQIEIFKELILIQNQSLNLLSRKNPLIQFEFLLEQSLMVADLLGSILQKQTILDIGTGNGFPGLLFAILFPKTEFHLCERIRKKSEFLKQVLYQTDTLNAKVFCQGAETLNQTYKIILSQATAPLTEFLKLLDLVLDTKGEAFLWQSSLWKQSWPDTSLYKATVFKTYKIKFSEKIILQINKTV